MDMDLRQLKHIFLVPYRGRRNEPAYVSFVAHKLAELHAGEPGMSVDRIKRITTENAKRLFKIA
ncbi:MAG: hypothetical protein E8D47_00330 [Nitrospira sp.]|nr:MAG: hypothetical protein E8D47_00330 [Nitrospira sp.]